MIYTSNSYLTYDQMKINAQYIMNFLVGHGWTKNAVSGALGNWQTESTLNSGLWESLDQGNMQGGFGLAQWTPATDLTNWMDSHGYQNDWTNMDGQLNCILWEVTSGTQWIKTSNYNLTFEEWTKSSQPPDWLAMAFLANYERPLNPNQTDRGTQAIEWYNTLNGNGGGGESTTQKSMPLFMYNLLNF